MSGRYEGDVKIVDRQESSSYRLVVDRKGRGGFVKGKAAVSLASDRDNNERTLVSVDSRAQVGGLPSRGLVSVYSSTSRR